MAANNAKPANSSDSETEWTFIDSYDGTIETRKDCVTYRKPTYSEAVKGVSEEELAEVESEPEFEVLASFQFRSKGESFGIGSSIPRSKHSSKLKKQAILDKTDGNSDESTDDDILVISSHHKPEKPVCCAESELTAAPKSSDSTIDGIVVVDAGYGYDDGVDDDIDMIDLGDSNIDNDWLKADDDDVIAKDLTDEELKTSFVNTSLFNICIDEDDDDAVDKDDIDDKPDDPSEPDVEPVTPSAVNKWHLMAPEADNDDVVAKDLTDEALNTSFINTSLFNICIDDEDDDDAVDKDGIDDKPDDPPEPDVEPVTPSAVNKWLLCIDTLESSKDLTWDHLTFKLMNTMPLIMASTSAVDNIYSSSFQKQDRDSKSDSSFEPISKSDSQDDTSSYDNLDDLPNDDVRLVPEWFFNPDYQPLAWDDFSDNGSFELVDDNISQAQCDKRCEENEENEPLIPDWLYDPYHNIYKDSAFKENVELIIPAWFYDPNHSTFDETFDESDYNDYSDWDSEYTDDSDEDDSAVAIPNWLFSQRKNKSQHQDDDSFLFSQLFVDVPTFIILLFLTTALGFSIGHGLTVYLSTHALNKNVKVPGPTIHSNAFPNNLDQRILTAEELAKVDLLKLEDEIYRQRESELLSSHLRYDLSNLHKHLQEKHHRLLRNHKSTEDRLHISKSMSWFWRLKYDQEKRRNENSSSVIYLQKQLERIGALYAKEKKAADNWRRIKKTRFPHKSNEHSDLRKLNSSTGKASLASKYWVQAILSAREIDWEGFKKRWTEDLQKLKNDSCASNNSFALKRKSTHKEPFGISKNKQSCKKANVGVRQQNATTKENKASLKTDKKKLSSILHDKVFGPAMVQSPTGPPEGPPKMLQRKSMFDVIKIKRTSRKGETARRRREKIRNERLTKREARRKVLEVELQVRELKNLLAELRKERRKAENEKYQLEASWRKLKRQREKFEKQKENQHKGEKKKLTTMKFELQKTKTRLKTWKSLAVQFKKKAVNLQQGMKQVSHHNKKSKEIKNIKRNLKMEKRKLRKQRQHLKALKNKMRKEHRNYAREGWKLLQKQKKLEKLKASRNTSSTSPKKCRKKINRQRKISRIRNKKQTRKPKASSKSSKNKKSRWKHKETFIKYWEDLEKSLKKWTQNLNKTVQDKSKGKIKKVWKKLQEKFGNLINFSWGKQKQTKPPFHTKRKHKKNKSKPAVSMIYQKILAEQLKFDEQKRKKSKGPVKKLKKKSKKPKDPDVSAKQRRTRQRRKYQRELERLQQWALQMNERKLEHERIYKDIDKTRSAKAIYKPKPNEKDKEVSKRNVDVDDIDGSSNLTNTLMLLIPPQFGDHQYESYTKQDPGPKTFLDNEKSVLHDVTMAQLQHDSKKQSTGLSITLDDDSILLPSTRARSIVREGDAVHEDQSIKPTPPLFDSSLYNKFPMLEIIDSNKGVPLGMPIPPPTLDPSPSQTTLNKQDDKPKKSWYTQKTRKSWVPPPPSPGPLQSDGLWFFQRSTDRSEQRQQQELNKESFDDKNQFRTEFINSDEKLIKKNGIWAFARASDRAEQRILYEPQNKQIFKKRSQRQSKKTNDYRHGHKTKVNDGVWMFQRANDREEQRLNKEPWYVRRAEGREFDREEEQNSWFIERGFDRDLQRNEDPDPTRDGYDDDYDDEDDDNYYYDIDFGEAGYDDIAAA